MANDLPSSGPSNLPSLSSLPLSSPSAPLTREDICPLDWLDPPEKYQILPYDDTITGDGIEDDLTEISYIAISDQMDPSGNRYAYVASDKEQFSLKAVQFTDNGLGKHFNEIGGVVATYALNLTDYTNDDWEDISLGPCTDSNDGSVYTVDQTCIYISNFGNNPRTGYIQ
jgi:hypothetical protein